MVVTAFVVLHSTQPIACAAAPPSSEQVAASCYRLILHRDPTAVERKSGARRVSRLAPTAVRQFCIDLARSKEFVNKYQRLPDVDKRVVFFYQELLERTPDEVGQAFWRSRIKDSGYSASTVQFFDSPEVSNRIYVGSKIIDRKVMSTYVALTDIRGPLDQQKRITKLQQYLESSPSAPPEAYLNLAECLGRPTDSLRWLDRATSVWTEDPLLHQRKATLLAANDKPEEALREINETLKLWSADLPSRKLRLDCLVKLRRYKEAVEEAVHCEKYEKDISAHLLYGMLDDKLENRENDAAWSILEAMRVSKAKGYNSAANYSLRAKVRLDIEQYDGAIEEATQCLRINSNDNQALTVRAKAYMSKNQPALAIPDLDKLVKLHPYYITFRMRAKAYAMQKKYALCQRDLTLAIKDNPSFAELYIERARYYLEMRNPKSAVADLNKSIALDKNIAESYRLRALAHRELNHLQDAFRDDLRARQVGKSWEDRITGER